MKCYGTKEWAKFIEQKTPSDYIVRNYKDIELSDY